MHSRFISVLCLIGLASPCSAGTIKQTNGPAALAIEFETRKLALADLITVTLTVEGSRALEVAAPLEAPAKWLLVERSKAVRENVGAARVRWKLIYRFAPREPGDKIPFAFPEVKFVDGEEQSASWTAITFEVASPIVAPDPSKLQDITAIETLPPIPPAEGTSWFWPALGAVCLLVIVAVLGLWLLLRRVPSRSAAQVALYELQRLVAMKLPEKGRSERFITLLTMLVRKYLERQLALPARRRTTPEFVRFLRKCETLTTAEKEFLSSFLQRCEAVKFAHEGMSAADCGQWAEATRRFLQDRMTSLRNID